MDRVNRINGYKNELSKLKSREELTDAEKKEIEIRQICHDLLLEDYGLTEKDFIDERRRSSSIYGSELQKTLIKRTPKIIIKKDIEYI